MNELGIHGSDKQIILRTDETPSDGTEVLPLMNHANKS